MAGMAFPSAYRRFQFRLRTLMIVVTLLAIPCAWVGWQLKIVRERERVRNNVPHAYKIWPMEYSGPFSGLFGDHAVSSIWFDESATDEEIESARRAFPEADVVTSKNDPTFEHHWP